MGSAGFCQKCVFESGCCICTGCILRSGDRNALYAFFQRHRASRLQLLAGELEWRLRLQEELSEGELNQLQQVFTQTREEVSHFLLTGEQQESVAFPFSPPDKRL